MTKSITEKTSLVDIGSPKSLAIFADELKCFVVANNLYTPIKDKNYVHVEGWQFAGASMGIFPVVERLENVSVDTEIKYRAEVKLMRISDGTVIGYGVAICSNKEQKKRSFDEYAIASMAQTRAVGKAFRMTIGWVMKLAGYEATPAEEASRQVVDTPVDDGSEVEIPIEDVKVIVDSRLLSMSAAEKVKFLKEWSGTVSDKNLDDRQYRRLYENLPRGGN